MTYESLKEGVPTTEIEVKTPLETCKQQVVTDNSIVIVPILRAGLGMVDGMLQIMPNAKDGHIGIYRDHDTLQPVEYFCKLPVDIADRDVIIVDPMLATGVSADAAIGFLRARGVKNIKFVNIVSAPEGLEMLASKHPDVEIYSGILDEKLNENGYILPGLGDAVDRILGTK